MTTVLTSYTLVPELQHQFNDFVIHSQLNKNIISPPVDISTLYLPTNSFINMLFDDNYKQPTYEYKYKYETYSNVPRRSIARLQIYPGSWKYVTIDSSSGDNIFALQQDDLTMLNALLGYRNGSDSTASFTFIDSTSTALIDTTGAYVLYTSFNSLSTELSKLIYLYLRLQILNDFSLYNNESIVSTGGMLETCYEAYLIDKYFTYITNQGPDLQYDCQCD